MRINCTSVDSKAKSLVKLMTALSIIMFITLFIYSGGASLVVGKITSSITYAIERWKLMFIITTPMLPLIFVASINR